MNLDGDIIVIAGWTKSGFVRFTIKELLYKEIVEDKNIYAALTYYTAHYFRELVGVAHFKNHMHSFTRTPEALEDISQEKYGTVSTSHIDETGFADWLQILQNMKHAGASILFIEDVAEFESETLLEVLQLMRDNGIRVVLNDTSETKMYTLGLNMRVSLKHLKFKDVYKQMGAKVCVGQYNSNERYIYLKELDSEEVHTFATADF